MVPYQAYLSLSLSPLMSKEFRNLILINPYLYFAFINKQSCILNKICIFKLIF